MVVLFKGIPLESSDGERLDKRPECNNPQLCINPNHTLLNVRDLEIYLANYINNQFNESEFNQNQKIWLLNLISQFEPLVKLENHKNIASPSVFSSQEFLSISKSK